MFSKYIIKELKLFKNHHTQNLIKINTAFSFFIIIIINQF